MYLTKILIRGTACHKPYEIHRVIWNLFPEDSMAIRDFLFRVERSDKDHAEVLMQSSRVPVSSIKAAQIIASKEYHLSLQSEQRLRFLIVANPVKTINDEMERKNSKGQTKKCRVPLIHDEEQRAWISRKLGDAASLEFVNIHPSFPLRFRKFRENRAGKIQPVIFRGVFKVDDTNAMADLIRKGIGPAKAFGCGLLSVARV
ncbi:MAG: type I-E CRISPR-associated protein Cas6/Cse3/CasE [Desulfobacterales bacterium]|nr:type I-E CRISPR-associated protein Cas6/Cse3/CasE [Desulfobacterales bacterium]MDD4072736.1 type I-E CRISPR-associated protein Cas6/Cse3/CasE [Desulfobacterales bacterium]MDD4392373.1 type I-E CRISPR-associated protein Cas6/Cse3/CasE [Desulfobacterales bacterium]